MHRFKDGVFFSRAFSDLDGLAEAATAWDLSFARMDRGEFDARIDMAMTGEMQITRLSASSSLLITGYTPNRTSVVNMCIASEGVRSRGRSIDVTNTTPARLHRGEVHFMAAGRLDLITVTTDQELFRRHVQTRFEHDAASRTDDWLLRTATGSASCPERGRALLFLSSVLSTPAARSREAKNRLQECVLQILLEGMETDAPPPKMPTLSTRRRVARAAEEVLRSRLDNPPSLRELCELLQVPERTLHLAFQEGFGMPPKAYLRALRLSAAHLRLRSARGSVTEVAADLGLFHFGRFSTEYREMFGESPSETLRRARGIGPGEA